MGIGMDNLIFFQKSAVSLHILSNRFIGFKDIQLPVFFDLGNKLSFAIHRSIDIKTISYSCQIVFMTMAGSSMNTACTLVKSYIISQNKNRLSINKGMTSF